MDFSTIDPELIRARGEYATVRTEFERHMEQMQKYAQTATDLLRKALNLDDRDEAWGYFTEAARLATKLANMLEDREDLRQHKDMLKPLAWGEK